jgi:hypothetical protein
VFGKFVQGNVDGFVAGAAGGVIGGARCATGLAMPGTSHGTCAAGLGLPRREMASVLRGGQAVASAVRPRDEIFFERASAPPLLF